MKGVRVCLWVLKKNVLRHFDYELRCSKWLWMKTYISKNEAVWKIQYYAHRWTPHMKILLKERKASAYRKWISYKNTILVLCYTVNFTYIYFFPLFFKKLHFFSFFPFFIVENKKKKSKPKQTLTSKKKDTTRRAVVFICTWDGDTTYRVLMITWSWGKNYQWCASGKKRGYFCLL